MRAGNTCELVQMHFHKKTVLREVSTFSPFQAPLRIFQQPILEIDGHKSISQQAKKFHLSNNQVERQLDFIRLTENIAYMYKNCDLKDMSYMGEIRVGNRF
ncbi:thioredoxin [Perkinsela sp. CCAP 1560/4]|nr:thioredoxin [Perkinsela sp. CCAP 1560/4]|eukprot:KNH04988.1 thioredoxin [Perkinsela sp. CCAP 1560/4]